MEPPGTYRHDYYSNYRPVNNILVGDNKICKAVGTGIIHIEKLVNEKKGLSMTSPNCEKIVRICFSSFCFFFFFLFSMLCYIHIWRTTMRATHACLRILVFIRALQDDLHVITLYNTCSSFWVTRDSFVIVYQCISRRPFLYSHACLLKFMFLV